jgi:hypothetical protein
VGGYSLELEARWEDSAQLVPVTGPGTRSYLIDSSGAIHGTSEHRRATLADETLPACDERNPTLRECAPYLPRQRWGVTPALPIGSLSLGSDSIPVGDTAGVYLTFAVRMPRDSVRSFAVVWKEGIDSTIVPVPAAVSRPASTGQQWFALRHVFADAGDQIVTATITTRDGSRYRFADTVRTFRATGP